MDKHFLIIFLTWISATGVLCQYYSPTDPLSKYSFVSASLKTYQNVIEPMCISQTIGQQGRIFSTGQSMENLIALIERLESNIENDTDNNLKQHLGADNVAKLFLRRFRYDGVSRSGSQNSRDKELIDMANAFFPQTEEDDTTYYFPDKYYSQAELCSLYYMLSHNYYNTDDDGRVSYSAVRPPFSRGKRQAYNSRQQQQQYPQQNSGRQHNNQNQRPNQLNRQYAGGNDNTNTAVNSNYLVKHPIREEGVVSFRGNQDEAIQASRVLIGVLAGLSSNLQTSGNAVLTAIKPRAKPFSPDKIVNPIMALTIADLWGSAIGQPKAETNYYFGMKGQWSSTSCTTHYALTDVIKTNYKNFTDNVKATKAELKGGLDGYLIAKNLRSMGVVSDTKSLRLSTILRSYYSKPRIQKSSTFTVSYCNRDQQINSQDISNEANAYAAILTTSKGGDEAHLNLLTEFTPAFQAVQVRETNNGLSDYCSMVPSGTLDENAPCETPSDVIYVIDATSPQKSQDSAKIVSQINGNLIRLGLNGGTVSIFGNSNGQNSINSDVNNVMPRGTGDQWPLVPIAFNSSNTGVGSAQCRIDDFNTTSLAPVANTGKYFKFLNQTLFLYEWWTRNPFNDSAVPAKTAVLIDYDSVPVAPESGGDRNDYNYYKDQLRYRHRDVKYLTITNNQDLFKDIIRDDSDKDSPTNGNQLGSNFAKKICENPATFQHNYCDRWKSNDLAYTGYVTPGYRQNWAMYPEFFLKSFDIYFKFKAEDGDIRVCYNRWFPPKNPDYCKDLKSGEEGQYHISNPCKGKSFSSCEPFYFTVWGKDRTSNTQCLDKRCQSLDQIKWTVSHSGVQCSSSNHLLPSITFQLTTLSIVAILYLFFNK